MMFELTRPESVNPEEFDAAVVRSAQEILGSRLDRESITDASAATTYIQMRLHGREHEVFAVMFLDTRHRVIEFAELFRGTIDSATVHPREVAKEALQRNAAAVILAHNHPSGIAEPSSADISLTRRLVEALALLDIRVLGHILVGHGETTSFADRGLM